MAAMRASSAFSRSSSLSSSLSSSPSSSAIASGSGPLTAATNGATLPSDHWPLSANVQDEIRTYIGGAQDWTPLQRAADARNFDALFALLRERPPLHERHDDAVAALAIAESDAHACAAPVDERCVELLRYGPVWSIANHALCPADERLAASARALLTGGRGIGPVPRREGGEIFIPTDVWRVIFSFLIFER